jgi:hypothetical protein
MTCARMLRHFIALACHCAFRNSNYIRFDPQQELIPNRTG